MVVEVDEARHEDDGIAFGRKYSMCRLAPFAQTSMTKKHLVKKAGILLDYKLPFTLGPPMMEAKWIPMTRRGNCQSKHYMELDQASQTIDL